MTKVPKDRDKALQRALKFAKLFQEDIFEAVLNSLDNANKTAGKPAFDLALENAGITAPEDKDWLYNYLQHMNEVNSTSGNKYWKDAKEAAAVTGW